MSKDNKRLGRGLEALLRNVAAAQTYSEPSDDNIGTDQVSPTFTEERKPFPAIVPFSSTASDSESDVAPKQNRVPSEAAKIEEEKDRALAQFSNGRTPSEIEIALIDPNPFQPRLDFDAAELDELQRSLKEHGLIQPIVLRARGNRYEIVAGERRFRAAQEVGWNKIPAILLVATDQEMAEIALTENMQRRDLNPIEKAVAFRNYLNSYGGTHEELAKRLTLDRSTISNLMRLLDLCEDVQQMTRRGEITMGHARALLSLDEGDQIEMANRIIEEQLSVRQTEIIVKEFLDGNPFPLPKPAKKAAEVSPRVQELEQQFRAWLGMKVKLTSNDKGKGKLVVQFSSNDEFERIYQALKPKV